MRKARKYDPIEAKILKETFGARVKEEKDDSIEVSSLIYGDQMVEEIQVNGEFAFAVFSRETGNITIEDSFYCDGQLYRPSVDDSFSKGSIKLPSAPEMIDELELDKLMEDFIGMYYWMDERTRFWGKKYAKYTWIYDFYHTCPFYGPWGAMGTGDRKSVV